MDTFWTQHSYLLYLAMLGLFALCCYLLKHLFSVHENKLIEICSGVTDLYDKYNNHEYRLSHLEGEHKVYHGEKQ